MTTQHKTSWTPGPWNADGTAITHPAYGKLCEISKGPPANRRCTWREDARLIAAAPELVEALRLANQLAKDQLAGLEHAPCTSEHCSGTCHRCAAVRRGESIHYAAAGALEKAGAL